MEKPFLCGNLKLNEQSLKQVFLFNLNQIYSVLKDLTHSLPVLADQTCYGDLQNVIEELLSEVYQQLGYVEVIYWQLNEVPTENDGFRPKAISEINICPVDEGDQQSLSSDLSLVFHLQQVLVVKNYYFQMLKSISNSLNDVIIKENIQYCYDQCADNQTVFKLIAKEYMESRINAFL
jgi:hypothetical protein